MTVTITQKERDDDQNKCEKENMASSSGLWDNMSQQVMTTHICSLSQIVGTMTSHPLGTTQ